MAVCVCVCVCVTSFGFLSVRRSNVGSLDHLLTNAMFSLQCGPDHYQKVRE